MFGLLLWPIANFLRLPSLRRLALAELFLVHNETTQDLMPETCQIDTLEISSAILRKEHLWQFSNSMGSLRHVEVHQRLFSNPEHVDFDQVLRALWHMRDQLESLSFSTMGSHYQRFEEGTQELTDAYAQARRDLRQFRALKTLALRHEALCESSPDEEPDQTDYNLLEQALPANIEHFTLWPIQERYMYQLQRLAEVAPEKLPRLRRLEFAPVPWYLAGYRYARCVVGPQEADEPASYNLLTTTCREHGISLATLQESEELWNDHLESIGHKSDEMGPDMYI